MRAWRQKGVRDATRVGFGRKLCSISGAVGPGGIKLHATDRLGGGEFINFLKMLYEEYGPFILIPYNASYHKSAAVNEFLESVGGRIILQFIPPYTPQMNPTETQWRVAKSTIAGPYPKTKEELQGLLERTLKDGTPPKAAMPEWLASCLAAAS